MKRLAILTGVVGVLGWMSGCGGDETSASPGASDSGAGGGSGGAHAGSGGSGGNGGASAGGAGARGGGGAGGNTGGTGGKVGSGGATADGAAGSSGGTTDASVDAAPDSRVAPEAGPKPRCAPQADGGLQWRDFSASTCKSCPATAIKCSDLLNSPSFDPTTRVLTLHLASGRAEVLTASLSLRYGYPLDAGGTTTKSATVSGVVDQNTITWDLSHSSSPNMTYVQNGRFTLVDACGQTSTDDQNDFAFEVAQNPDGGAPNLNVHCDAL